MLRPLAPNSERIVVWPSSLWNPGCGSRDTRSGGFLLMGSPAFAERRGRPTQRNGIEQVIWRGLFDTSRENRAQLCGKFGLSVRL